MRDWRLIEATQQVIRNGLTLLGVSSPERCEGQYTRL